MSEEKKKRFKMPSALVILFFLMLFVTILTYFVPAGEFGTLTLETGQEVADPNQFQFVDANPVGFIGFWAAFPKGMVEAATVIAFTLIISGALEVIKQTGVIDIAIYRLSQRFADNGIWVIPILMFVLGTIATFIGTEELSMVYIPIILPLMISLGFDNLTATAVVILSTHIVGVMSSMTNPFNVGVSHEIAGLPMFSGLWLRGVLFIVLFFICVIYTMRYARSIHTDVEKATQEAIRIGAIKEDEGKQEVNDKMTSKQIGVGLVSIALFAVILALVIIQGWGMIEMAGAFVLLGVVAGLIGGMGGDRIVDGFVNGAIGVMSGSILIGVATGISVIMQEAKILDTIVYYFGNFLQSLPLLLSALAIFIFIALFAFFVPSGSGKAVVTMPIISPLARMVGLNQQVSVLAYVLGDGVAKPFYPTSGTFMATLDVSKVKWQDWAKFYLPLMAILAIVSIIFIIFAQFINYGPF
ncbi:YfcC family protein [Aerococcus kribbianus]|uniref:YfcC family protein n=1 Tax=Aerococcus kribbianus TaxID=2999064 RepID=A0A9X3JF82_9LACT|nr:MULTISPECIES: hypothetical protein [unclassified Aerococcus]MCZ0716812.1 hypothetical protein [Aerococcus sp. YH-aer221]MCZ0725100.1 hypothetical protein [Aerococcus sp. YH-aer222]